MTTYTTAQIRSAILRAADTIDDDSTKWNFCKTTVSRCGTPMCAAGWIGFYLGADEGETLSGALRMAGFEKGGERNTEYAKFQDDMNAIDAFWHREPARAAKCLRAYADKYFPSTSTLSDERAAPAGPREKAIDPAFSAFKAAFVRTMEEA